MRASRASSTQELGELTCAELGRALGPSSRQLIVTEGTRYDPVLSHFESDEVPPADLFDEMVRRQADTMTETGASVFAAASRQPTIDIGRVFPGKLLRRLAIYNEFWRPWRIAHQAVHFMSDAGFVAVARPASGRPFDERELREVDEIGTIAGVAFRGLTAVALAEDLASVVAILEQLVPHPAALFRTDGRLLWLTDEAVVRLGVESERSTGSGRAITRANRLLDALRSRAISAAGGPHAARTEADDFEALGLLPGEELVLRHFPASLGDGGYVLAMVVSRATRAWARCPSDPPHGEENRSAESRSPGNARDARHPRLSAREVEVAHLAAEGYTVLNIAARLSLSPHTVKTHLKRLYGKLGIGCRVELVSRGFGRRR